MCRLFRKSILFRVCNKNEPRTTNVIRKRVSWQAYCRFSVKFNALISLNDRFRAVDLPILLNVAWKALARSVAVQIAFANIAQKRAVLPNMYTCFGSFRRWYGWNNEYGSYDTERSVCQPRINRAVISTHQRCVRVWRTINLFALNGLFVICIVFDICNRSYCCCFHYNWKILLLFLWNIIWLFLSWPSFLTSFLISLLLASLSLRRLIFLLRSPYNNSNYCVWLDAFNRVRHSRSV